MSLIYKGRYSSKSYQDYKLLGLEFKTLKCGAWSGGSYCIPLKHAPSKKKERKLP